MATTQQRLASILPHITGLLSWLGSLSIIIDVIRRYRRRGRAGVGRANANKPKPYHRLMFGMSVYDMCASSAWMMSTWPVPADTPNVYAALGTDATCKTQAFFNQLGIAVPFYNLCLAVYYYLVIVKDSPPSIVVERCMHFICFAYAICTATSALALDLFGYATFWCWIKGEHGLFRWLFWYGPLWVIIALVSAIMTSIYCSLAKQEYRSRRWRGTYQFRARVSQVIRRLSHTTPARQGRQIRRPATASDNVKWQAFLYVGSFFLTWIFLTIVRGMQTVGSKSIPYWIILAGVTLCPSQGLFNFLVYIRPRYKQHRKKHPDAGRFLSFLSVNPLYVSFTSCCHTPPVRSFAGGSVETLRSVRSRVLNTFRGNTDEGGESDIGNTDDGGRSDVGNTDDGGRLNRDRANTDACLDYNSQGDEDCDASDNENGEVADEIFTSARESTNVVWAHHQPTSLLQIATGGETPNEEVAKDFGALDYENMQSDSSTSLEAPVQGQTSSRRIDQVVTALNKPQAEETQFTLELKDSETDIDYKSFLEYLHGPSKTSRGSVDEVKRTKGEENV